MTAPRPRNQASPQSTPDCPPFPVGGLPSFNSSLQTFARIVPGKVVRHPFVHALLVAVVTQIHSTGRGPPGSILSTPRQARYWTPARPTSCISVKLKVTQLNRTTSSSDDAAATGWNPSVYALNFQGSWSFPDSEKLKFRVNGRADEPTINHLSEIRSAGPTLRLGAAAMNWPVVPLPSLSASNRFFIMIFNSNSRKREVNCKIRN